MKEEMEWLHATDIESGERTSVQVSKSSLQGLPANEPERTNFIKWLHDVALKNKEQV